MPNNNECKNCSNVQWKNHYILAQQRFDKVVTRLVIGEIIAFTIVVICLCITIFSLFQIKAFIENFECVEETSYKIEQDEGVNTAVIDSDDVEVILNGADDNKNNKKIFSQKENNKGNV